MSGVYIPGMEMPKCCGRCDFFDPFKSVALLGPLGYCKRTGDEVLFIYRRKENCPIIPAADVRPVVLCKDCKNRFNYGDLCVSRGDDWFCGYGERKHNCGARMEEQT